MGSLHSGAPNVHHRECLRPQRLNLSRRLCPEVIIGFECDGCYRREYWRILMVRVFPRKCVDGVVCCPLSFKSTRKQWVSTTRMYIVRGQSLYIFILNFHHWK